MNKTSAGFWIFFWIILVESIVVICLIPTNYVDKVIKKEYLIVKERLGEIQVESIHADAKKIFQSTLIDNGFYSIARAHVIPATNTLNGTNWWFEYVDARLRSLASVYYHFLTRFELVKLWSPYILLLLFPAIFDGYIAWKIKRTNFNYSSPAIHTYSSKIFIIIVCSLIALFIAPLVLDPAIIPIALMFMAVLVGLFIGNIQKRI